MMRDPCSPFFRLLVVFAAVGCWLFTGNPAMGQPARPFARGQVIVKFRAPGNQSEIAESSLASFTQKFGAKSSRKIFSQTPKTVSTDLAARLKQRRERADPKSVLVRLGETYLLDFDLREDVKILAQRIASDPSVEYAEPNYILHAYSLPNDTYIDPDQNGAYSQGTWGQTFEDMWGLKTVQAPDAWQDSACVGNCRGEGVVVAVVDTGLDRNHPDIQGNIFINPGEVANDGIDNDNNGLIDDVNGYDFTTCAVFGEFDCLTPKSRGSDTSDGRGHGTHVSGTIAAVAGNGIGIAGVAPNVKILPVKALNDQGGGFNTDLAEAIRYAVDTGADVINNSWGGPDCFAWSAVLEDAVRYAVGNGTVVVFAAGNDNCNIADLSPQNMPEVLTVAAIDHFGQKSFFSNYGNYVDLAAPGGGDVAPPETNPSSSILSLLAAGSWFANNLQPRIVGTDYLRVGGTSMAAPHAAGAAALVISRNPSLTEADVRNQLKNESLALPTPSSANLFLDIGTGIVTARTGLPNFAFVSYQVTPANDFIKPQDIFEITLRLELNHASVPITGFLSTNRPDLEMIQNQSQFLQEGATPIITNTASRFRVKYLGSEPALLGDIVFDIRLTGVDVGLPVIISVLVPPLTGWPKTTGNDVYSAPTISDVDPNTSGLEIVASSTDGKVYVWRTDGNLAPGSWPKTTGGFIQSSPLVIDLDPNFTGLEITVGSSDRKVYAWHRDGSVVTGWPKTLGDQVYAPPAGGDLDPNYSGLEVVVGSFDRKVYAWHADGTAVPGWPQLTGGVVASAAAIVDLDPNNPGLEVATGSVDKKVYVWGTNGVLVPGWPQLTEGAVVSSPAVADLDPSYPGLEIVIGSRDDKVYAWHSDGTLVAGWPVTTGADVVSSPALANMDTGDPGLEVVVGSGDAKVYAWHRDGSPVTGWPKPVVGVIESSPAVANLDPTYPGLEIIVGSGDKKVYAWHSDGTLVPGWPTVTAGAIFSSPAVADMNGDGKLEVVVGSDDDKVYAWRSPHQVNDGAPWPMFHHDPARTGLYVPINSPPVLSLIGNRVVDENANLNFTLSAADPENDPLVYSASNLPQGAGFVPATHAFSWTPNSTQAGAYSNVHFQVSDGGLSDFEDITITVLNVNRPPVLNAIGNKVANEGELLNFTLSATDPDGDPLIYSAAGLPQGADFDPATQMFQWTPGFTQAGAYSDVHFAVSDGDLSASEDITITVLDRSQPPAITSITNYALGAGSGQPVISPVLTNAGKYLYWIIRLSDPDAPATFPYLTAVLQDGAAVIPVPTWPAGANQLYLQRFQKIKEGCTPKQEYRFYMLVGPEYAGKTFQVVLTPLETLPNGNPGQPTTITVQVDNTIYDRTPPQGTILINGGATHTASPDVTLTLTATDLITPTNQIQMRFLTNSGQTFTPFEPFSPTRNITLSGPDGTKTVYVQYRDQAGNTSWSYDSITLQTAPP